jgi:integrase
MATVKYLLKGKKTPSTIYIRFRHGRKYDFTKSTSLIIDPKYWNASKGVVKQISTFKDKLNLQKDLNNLYNHVLNKFNDVYSSGEVITSDWLNNAINEKFNQSDEIDMNLFTDFAEYFHVNLNNKVQANGKTGVTSATLKKYRTVINKVKEFERLKKKRVKLVDVNLKFHKDFIHFLHNTQKLNYNTTGKYLVFVKTICLDAKKYGLKIHKDIKNGEFRPTKEKVSFITLNEKEISKILKKDLRHIPHLNNAKNWLIIGVWTGARVSDLLRFSLDNINNGFIEYTSKKTNQKIILPLHSDVKMILNSNNGEFPKRISSQKFNDYIKKVCKLTEINQLISGSKMKKLKPKVWRKIKGEYQKHELISTHICRRSFATNHYGKLPTPVIMAVTGHTTEKMFLNYIGKTAKDNAKELQNFWKLQEQKNNLNLIL